MQKIKLHWAETERKWIVEETVNGIIKEYRSGSRAKAIIRLFIRHPGITVFYLSFAKNNKGDS